MIICKYKILSDVLIEQNSANLTHTHTFTGTAVDTGNTSNSTVSITDPGHTHAGHFGTGEGNRGGSYSAVPTGYTTTTGSAKTGITAKHEHTHSVTAKGTNSSSGGDESRPFNFTIKVWKRIA